jgi:hypothetical protein
MAENPVLGCRHCVLLSLKQFVSGESHRVGYQTPGNRR